ncbi:hypothetical protein [Flavobacterium alkalisoli]|uniref:hypothetical protein n=1 Tax=Flavobacterium alkalisoli TaxID=2602769 RepID=UPI003A8EB7ED
MKKLLETIPEFYYIGLGAFTIINDYYANGYNNYLALLITWLIFLQVFYKHKLLGLLYGNVLTLFSVYMLLNAFSDYRETGSSGQLFFNAVVFGAGFLMAVAMVYKFAVAESRYNENELTITY